MFVDEMQYRKKQISVFHRMIRDPSTSAEILKKIFRHDHNECNINAY